MCTNSQIAVLKTHNATDAYQTPLGYVQAQCICSRTNYFKYYSKITFKMEQQISYNFKCIRKCLFVFFLNCR